MKSTIWISIFFLFTAATDQYSQTFQPNRIQRNAWSTSRLRVYWHIVLSNKKPMSAVVASAATTNASATRFGMIRMIDTPLTERPELNSTLVGRTQGFYASASQEEVGFLMNMNLVFLEGEYNGSTITVVGRNVIMDKLRELSIVGGTGAFRLARGYVELRTHTFDLNSGDAIVQYDIVVYH